jgi:molybdate transport system substrate-binding protein
MNRIVAVLIALTALAAPAAVERASAQTNVRVAAAADLKFAFDELIERFTQANPTVTVDAVYGSSGNFHAQLLQRAPFDMYLSADVGYPKDLIRRGLASGKDLFPYAIGHLVIWVPRASPLTVERDGLRALQEARRIAIANPMHAPYGRAAEAALKNAGLLDSLRPRLVLVDTVSQAAQFVQSGAADAGVIGKALAISPAMRDLGRYTDVPPQSYPQLLQAGLILPWTTARPSAVRLRDYLLGAEGRRILQSYGFDLPPATALKSTPAR